MVEKILPPAGLEPKTARPADLTHRATRAPPFQTKPLQYRVKRSASHEEGAQEIQSNLLMWSPLLRGHLP